MIAFDSRVVNPQLGKAFCSTWNEWAQNHVIVSAHWSSLRSWPGSRKLSTQLLHQWDEVGKQLRTELCSLWTPDISCLTLDTCNSFLVEDHRAERANKYLGFAFEAGVPSPDISCALGDTASCLLSSCEQFVWGLGVQKGSKPSWDLYWCQTQWRKGNICWDVVLWTVIFV